MTEKQCLGAPETPTQLREAASRVTDSVTFRHAPRLRDFLAFVVQRSLDGRRHEINEYSIGVQVFGKHPNYNPNQDNIVRVTARQLRSKLTEYYAHEGSSDPWRVEIPKGGYLPSVVPNIPVEPPRADPRLPPPRRSPSVVVALAVLCAAGWITAAWLELRRPHESPEPAYLLTPILADKTQTTTIVLDDPVFGQAWWRISSQMGLDGFVNGRYLDSMYYSDDIKHLQPMLARNNYVESISLQTMKRLTDVARSHFVDTVVTSCRTLKPEQLKKGNFIIVGGVSSNPWVGELQKNLAFEHVFDRSGGSRSFLNKAPRPGEPAAFETTHQNPDERYYTRVALMKNPYGPGKIALLGGTHRDATEAAGQFALSQTGLDELKRVCGVSAEKLTGFELILETKSLAGADLIHHVVASRCRQ